MIIQKMEGTVDVQTEAAAPKFGPVRCTLVFWVRRTYLPPSTVEELQ